jgi:3-hydroxyisobutyrate dehydrogenase/putative dehydrogenase
VAYDIVPRRAAALTADGLQAAESITGAVRDAELVAIMVATPDQVDQVLFGPGGAAAAVAAGAVVMIMATVGPEVVAEVAARLGSRGVTVVDAPVSGGVQRAAAGDLLIMVSGADDAVGRARPLLDVLARSAPVVGPAPGDGQRMKLVNQLLCGVHIAAAAEALAFAESLGLDPGECWRVLRDGAAASFMFEDRGARMAEGVPAARSALDIFVKDMGLVSAAAEHAGAVAPLTAVTRRLYEKGHERGLGRLDDAALIEVLRQDRPSAGGPPAVEPPAGKPPRPG